MISDQFAIALRKYTLSQIQNSPSGNSPVAGITRAKRSTIYSSPTPTSFYVGVQDMSEITPYFVYDAIRFANAMIESAHNTNNTSKHSKSIAWDIIETYYAAFYAGQSMLRLMGESFSYIDSPIATAVASKHSLYGHAYRPKTGEYYVKCNSNFKYVEFISLSGTSGGTHEKFWSIFAEKLRFIESDIIINTPSSILQQDAVDISNKLTDFRKLLDETTGNGSWLSKYRNDINYKNPDDKWFPYKNIPDEYDRIPSWREVWLKSPPEINVSNIKSELERFYSACHFLMALCRVLIIDASHTSVRRSNAFSNSPIRAIALFNK